MIKKILKSFIIFLVIFGISFSNIPFYALSGLIASYEKTSGIVDKIWLLEQNSDSSIVDNFLSIRNISEKLRVMEAMAAAPTYVNKGAFASGVGALTVAVPASYTDGDIFFLFIESANEAIATPAGWTQAANSPQFTGTAAAAGGVRLAVFYKVVSGAQSSVSVADSGNHTTAIIVGFRGVDTTIPIDITAGAVSAATTAMSLPSVTTSVADTFVILVAAMDTDANSTATVASWANANLTSITERHDQTVSSGVGGGLAIATGGKTTAGATGATTATGSTSVTHAYLTIALKPAPPATAISNFVSAEPGNSTIAPGASGEADSFGFATNSGTDTVTAATVALAPGMWQYIQTVAITNDAGGTTYCSAAPSGDSVSITGCTIPVSAANTQFKIKITADPHASMPIPAGGSYDVTGTITEWIGTNATHTGVDSGSSTLTIDNASPAGTTGANAIAGDGQADIGWTNPGGIDFQQVYIYCKTSSMISGEAPIEGTDPAVDAAACNGTARLKYKGAASPQTISGLINETLYYFRIYARDTNGNFSAYSATQEVSAMPQPSAPNITSFTNIETALDNLGGRVGQTITISGTGFGTVANGSQANCAGGVGTGCLQIGAYTIPDANIGTWSAGSIDFTVPAAIPVYGTTITVIAASQADASPPNFKVYPDITAISPSGTGEAEEGDTITITGTRFGSAQGVNKVTIDGVPAAIIAWADTFISAIVPTAINDANNSVAVRTYQGTGGDNAIYDNSSGFIILPTISGTTDVPTGVGDAAREYAVSDNDGVFTILGKHFGAAGSVTILGGIATQQTTASCAGTAYQATCVGLRVPNVAGYTGNIVITRTADSKTNSYAGFRILPRIISATSGGRGDTISITGDHLCQSGSAFCPVAFDLNNKVSFSGGEVISGSSVWTDASTPSVVIPLTANDGNLNISSRDTAGGINYVSNNLFYNIVSTAPAIPTNLRQFKADGITLITVGSGTSESNVVLKGDSTAETSISMVLEVEVKQTYELFDGTSIVASSVQVPGTVFSDVAISISGLTNGSLYHWRARAKNSVTGETSGWVSFGGNIDGETDFSVDTVGPAISNVISSSVTDIQATIVWNTNESATQQVAYSLSCPTGKADAAATFSALVNKQPSSPAGTGISHSVILSGLAASTGYYYMVRSADGFGNYSYNPAVENSCNNFSTTAPQTRVMKTLEFYIEQKNDGTAIFSKSFDIFISESKADRSNIYIKSAIVEVFGVSKGSGSGDITVTVGLNGAVATNYFLADPGINSSTYWTFDHNANSLNFDCVSCTDNGSVGNTLDVNVGGAASTSLLGAKAIITYYYEPL